ncbi:hypothetical protein MTO96_038835, partial [Rhipicephalus appendiculatus]
MRGLTSTLAVAVLCIGNIVLAKLGAPGGPRKLPYDVPDAFQVFTQYKDAVAISDSDNDTTFDCLVTRRINIDYEAQTATYIWTFKDSSSRPDVFFQVSRGPKPGTVEMTVGD